MKSNLKPLRRALKAHKIRQVELAAILAVSESTVSRYLHGRLPFPRDARIAILAVLEARSGRAFKFKAA